MAKLPKSSATKLVRDSTGNSALGANIRQQRLQAQLTQEQLANLCAVTKGWISQVEKGTTMPGVANLEKIGEKLNCGVDVLLWGGSAARFHHGAESPIPTLDRRIHGLPEAMREFVIMALDRAEIAAKHVPAKYMRPPTAESWPEYAAYLEALSKVGK